MPERYLTSVDQRVRFATDCMDVLTYFDEDLFPYSKIPSLSVGQESRGLTGFTVVYADDTPRKPRLSLASRCLEVSGRYGVDIPGAQPFVFLLMAIFERLYQENDRYGMQASAVGKEGECVLFQGGTLSGKTALALEMCKRRGYHFLGDERLVVGRSESSCIVGGNSALSVRLDSLMMLDEGRTDHRDRSGQFIKVLKTPHDLGIRSVEGDHRIRAILNTHLVDGHIEIKKPERSANIVRFYMSISYVIRGLGFGLFDLGYPLPSLDNEKLAMSRLKLVQQAVDEDDIRFYEVVGEVGDICDFAEAVLTASD